MKKLLFALVFVSTFMSCEKEEPPVIDETPTIAEATIIGRWHIEGFDNVLYQFTADKRFTLYANTDNVFPTLEEFMEENPALTGNDWVYEGNIVVVDLNFGNYSRLTPNFRCDNYVIDWMDENGDLHSTYVREDYDISNCN